MRATPRFLTSAALFSTLLAAACTADVRGNGSGGGGGDASGVSTTGTGTNSGGGPDFTGSGGGTTSAAGGEGQGGEDPGPACGDGAIDPGEACDDGNGDSGDGCTGTCDAVESGFACPFPGEDCVSTVECGDSAITGAENCDDGNDDPGDGCDETCTAEPGYQCPYLGALCIAFACGDGIVAGDEECEDDDGASPANGDGCSDTCQLEPGFKCDVPGDPCVPTVCGDGLREGSEQCDDGDNDMGDGCTPFCIKEPSCVVAGPCTTSCGDGIMLPNGGEDCEDGNTEPGDGCSPTCEVEMGFDCVDVTVVPTELRLPIVLRDFKIAHPDFQYVTGDDLGIVTSTLGADGKPVYAGNPSTPTTTSQANFDQWYRDVQDVNLTVLQEIVLTQQMNGTYRFNDSTFFPLNGLGWGNEGNGNNFHFTSEVRYWFEYQGGEQLDFTGDDDVWVFVNKKLAVNLGGVHGAQSGGVTLDATAATNLGLQVGEIYEIVVFQAERHTTESNYRLTLGNFANTTSSCESDCGDGFKTPDEACDDGVNDGSYGSCTPECGLGPRCGDGVLQPDEEECDDGLNLSPYDGCAPGCVEGAFCGDGNVDSLFGEQCDDGTNDGGYGECAADCLLGERCGDGEVQSPQEQCDDGNKQGGDGCSAACKNESPE